jgi:hypothetical protein
MDILKRKSFCGISIVLSLLLFVGVFAMGTGVANATTYSYDSSGRSFSKGWSSTPVDDANRTMKYGFNTTAIDEDYTHTYHRTKSHTAYVKNSARAQTKKGAAGNYSKPEIQHASGKVYYEYIY